MSGLAVTEYVMAYCPTPILIVSSSTNRGELFKTYEALAAGGIDVLEKPEGKEPDGDWEAQLISTVKLVSKIKVITHPRARLGLLGRSPAPAITRAAPPSPDWKTCRLIAIGASTGGPGAVMEILKSLPPTFPLPILLVIHLPKSFSGAFADWLDGQSPLRVSYATEGEPLPPRGRGRVIMAPPDRHMVLRRHRIQLIDDPERHSCRPSVDVLFESIADGMAEESVACLLTGMGRDGAEGLLKICRAGGVTVAQDEKSSIVYGMPREAVLLGAAQRILPLDQIAGFLTAVANGNKVGETT
jgi:two-component system chemotaxis response regulator CheB